MTDPDLFSEPEPELPSVCGSCASFTESVLGTRHFCADSLMDARACDPACPKHYPREARK